MLSVYVEYCFCSADLGLLRAGVGCSASDLELKFSRPSALWARGSISVSKHGLSVMRICL